MADVTMRVLKPFRNRHDGEMVAPGDTITTDTQRAAELEANRLAERQGEPAPSGEPQPPADGDEPKPVQQAAAEQGAPPPAPIGEQVTTQEVVTGGGVEIEKPSAEAPEPTKHPGPMPVARRRAPAAKPPAE